MKIAFKMKTYNILSIDEFKTNIENNSRLLGIDPGNRNIGFAICDENKKVATPLKIVSKTKFETLIKEIIQIIEENDIKGIIIGNPINMDGSMGKSSQSVSDFAKKLSKKVASNKGSFGILVCGSGTGMAMAANKFKNIRAALCYSKKNTKLSRLHNNANIITLGERLIDKNKAFSLIKIFLSTKFEGGRHLRRVKKM